MRLTLRELGGYGEWEDDEDQALKRDWQALKSYSEMAETLGRSGGTIMSRAWKLGLLRPRKRSDWFGCYQPTWRARRLRDALIEAERRGLNKKDNGEDLDHRALKLRFRASRRLARRVSDIVPVKWPIRDLSALRNLRDEGRSIRMIAHVLDRRPVEVARRLLLEGRNVRGFRWMEEEYEVLIDGVSDGLSPEQVASKLPGRSVGAVILRARRICPFPTSRRAWATFELQTLIDGFVAGKSWDVIALRLLGRSGQAARKRIYELTHMDLENEPWRASELQIVRMARKRGESAAEIAIWLNRPVEDVALVMRRFEKQRHGRLPVLTPAQAEEAAALRKQSGMTMQAIANNFGVSRTAVYNATRRIGVVF